MHRARAGDLRLSVARRRTRDPSYPPATVNSVSILAALVAIAIALAIGLIVGARQRKGFTGPVAMSREPATETTAPPPSLESPATATPAEPTDTASEHATAERARIIRSFEAETAMLRRAQVTRDAALVQLSDFAADRHRVYGELAAARAETARYRQLVVDLENNAPPPFFGVGAPDDLKLIVGVGPVLERMLQQLGITTYRQIARWNERDIDEFDAKLPEFPGRIRRDAWVTQARALHASKYGAPPSARDR
jgi:predicted flap endonuclease-1-like 5' DNA nuclease